MAIVAFACGSDSDDGTGADDDTEADEATVSSPTTEDEAVAEEATEPAEEEATETTTASPDEDRWADVTGPAPGVDDDSVKIGFAYVDGEALNSSIGSAYNFGDQEGAYVAVIDAINANGGVHGRQIEAVIQGVNPVNPIGAEETCVQLTQDEEVFLVAGFWFRDTVTCPVGLNATATVGGEQSPERLEQAEAPWISWEPDTDQPKEVVRTFADEGLLDGNLGVFVTAGDTALMDELVLPTLAEIGIEPTAIGVMPAPSDDRAAVQTEVQLIGEKFEVAGVDTVLIVGPEGVLWPRYMQDVPYKPQLLFQDLRAGGTLGEFSDTAAETLEGALAGGPYGPDQAQYEDQTMQDCIAIAEAAGVEVPQPDDTPTDEPNNNPYSATFTACKDLTLVTALLEAAGPNLNYGTLELAIEQGFEVTIPGDPAPRTYGPPPSSDGDPATYLYMWNGETQAFERVE